MYLVCNTGKRDILTIRGKERVAIVRVLCNVRVLICLENSQQDVQVFISLRVIEVVNESDRRDILFLQ